MVELKTQSPYVDEDGNEVYGLEFHYAENEHGERFYIKQLDTGVEYMDAVDRSPCTHSYATTNKKIKKSEEK